jgi:hypothetical protein
MKLGPVAWLVIPLSTLAGIAQTTNQQQGPAASFGIAGMEGPAPSQQNNHLMITVLRVEQQDLNGCPVSLHAGHLADGSMVQASGAHPSGLGQWLSLSFGGLDQKQIASATLTVHGLTAKPRMSQALTADNGRADVVRTFHVPFAAGPQKSAVTKLWVSGMSVVERIDVQSVEYSDGSTWKVAEGGSCHVVPDPFMLIMNR